MPGIWYYRGCPRERVYLRGKKMAIGRRGFFAGLAAGAGVASGFFGARLIEYMGSARDVPWRTLTEAEAETLGRLADEIIPPDPPDSETGLPGIPGAREAGVVRFLDWQLAEGAAMENELEDYRTHVKRIGEMKAAEVEKAFPDFFKRLAVHVKMGYFGNPRYGGNFEFASYRMLGVAGPNTTGRDIPQ